MEELIGLLFAGTMMFVGYRLGRFVAVKEMADALTRMRERIDERYKVK